jgi:hypothetical protein
MIFIIPVIELNCYGLALKHYYSPNSDAKPEAHNLHFYCHENTKSRAGKPFDDKNLDAVILFPCVHILLI